MKKSQNHKKKLQKTVLLLSVLALTFVVTGCAKESIDSVEDPPGFLKGLFHGFIVLFSFIGSIFTDFKIYSIYNSGVWYDFGFILGVMMFFGGSGAGVKKKRK